MEGGLDIGMIWSAVITILVAVGVFVGNGWRMTIRDLRAELNALKVKLPEEYVSKKGLHEMIDPMREDIREIKTLLLKGIRPQD